MKNSSQFEDKKLNNDKKRVFGMKVKSCFSSAIGLSIGLTNARALRELSIEMAINRSISETNQNCVFNLFYTPSKDM